jgi:hypothetical protein
VQEGGEGEPVDLGRRGRPDAGRHRDEVELAHLPAVAARVEKLAQGAGQRRPAFREPGRLAIETQEVGEHAQEARSHEVGGLREHRRQAAAGPLQLAIADAHRQRHVGIGASTQRGENFTRFG